MELSYLGGGCVRIVTKAATLVVDPDAQVKDIAAKADVILETQSKDLSLPGMTFSSPGEYEVKGVMITGIPGQLHVDGEGQDATMFTISYDGVTAAVMGNIAPGLSKEQIGAIGKVDVLVVPVGGHGLTLDAHRRQSAGEPARAGLRGARALR